jgi:signal peptidase I
MVKVGRLRLPVPVRRVLFGVQAAAVAALLLLVGALLVGAAPALFGYESLVVFSGSMRPAIEVGDLLVVGPVAPERVMVGDVMSYRTAERPDVVVTHRVVGISVDPKGRLSLQTKGDANDSVDTVLVDQGSLVGRVLYSIPRLGYVVEFTKRPVGRIAWVGVPGLLLALDYVMGLRRQAGGSRPAPHAAPDTGADRPDDQRSLYAAPRSELLVAEGEPV